MLTLRLQADFIIKNKNQCGTRFYGHFHRNLFINVAGLPSHKYDTQQIIKKVSLTQIKAYLHKPYLLFLPRYFYLFKFLLLTSFKENTKIIALTYQKQYCFLVCSLDYNSAFPIDKRFAAMCLSSSFLMPLAYAILSNQVGNSERQPIYVLQSVIKRSSQPNCYYTTGVSMQLLSPVLTQLVKSELYHKWYNWLERINIQNWAYLQKLASLAGSCQIKKIFSRQNQLL